MEQNLEQKARQYRLDILDMLYGCQSGHPGGSLSCVEILQALYENVMKYDPKNPHWADRDRMVLSKGHACPTLYAVLADKGFFPKEELKNLRQLGSILQGHPDMLKCPGVDASTGSLGQGASWALGYALAGKRAEHPFNVYCVTGDGESQEGMIWESAMAAAHYRRHPGAPVRQAPLHLLQHGEGQGRFLHGESGWLARQAHESGTV